MSSRTSNDKPKIKDRNARTLQEDTSRRRGHEGVNRPVVPPSQDAIRSAIDAQMCPWCSRGPFAMLPVHTNKMHGVDKWELRNLAGLTTNDPLCSEDVRAKMSAAFDPERGNLARAAAASKRRREPRRTIAGKRKNIASLQAWVASNPDEAGRQREKAARSRSPGKRDAARKRWDALSEADREAFWARSRTPEAEAKRAAKRAARRVALDPRTPQ